MTFFEGIFHPIEYINDKYSDFEDDPVKPSLLLTLGFAFLITIGFGFYLGPSMLFDIIDSPRSFIFSIGLISALPLCFFWTEHWLISVISRFLGGSGSSPAKQLMGTLWASLLAAIPFSITFIFAVILSFIGNSESETISFTSSLLLMISLSIYFGYRIASISAVQHIEIIKSILIVLVVYSPLAILYFTFS